MRRPRLQVPSPTEINSTSPPRIRQRMSLATQLLPCEQSSPVEIESKASFCNKPGSEREKTSEYTPCQTENSIWNPWTSTTTTARERQITTAESATSTRLKPAGINSRYNNDALENNNIEVSSFNPISSVEEFLLPLSDYFQFPPDSESEQGEAGEPPPLLLDHHTMHGSLSPIPRNLLCDEQITYEYSKNGEWVGGFIHNTDGTTIQAREMEPSTSTLALQRLFALQKSAWMQRPNIVVPQTDAMRLSAQKANLPQPLEKEPAALEAQRTVLGLNIFKISII
ncbi:PREDICTED: uncharacterized protein LOC108377339 [Rhagoletis zephyria]|uniref:uncharacterized protein LOC108377339 n=1 Tax=Rhagoletis zephyria TaxID=28612 RepID=UPI0008116111|nr:PREDICTED: uncharacterized protein LOC108377339 [Rhagoletis zephyria]